MRLTRPQKRAGVISLTSLIDVIFLLLLFFMLSTSFSRYVEMPLASTSSALNSIDDVDPPEVFVVELGRDMSRLNREDVAQSDIIAHLHDAEFSRAQIFLVARDGLMTDALMNMFQELKRLDNASVSLLTDSPQNEGEVVDG